LQANEVLSAFDFASLASTAKSAKPAWQQAGFLFASTAYFLLNPQ
jgi:hypothetical protein